MKILIALNHMCIIIIICCKEVVIYQKNQVIFTFKKPLRKKGKAMESKDLKIKNIFPFFLILSILISVLTQFKIFRELVCFLLKIYN